MECICYEGKVREHMTTSDEEALQEKEALYIQVMTQAVPSSQKKGRFPTFDNVAWTF